MVSRTVLSVNLPWTSFTLSNNSSVPSSQACSFSFRTDSSSPAMKIKKQHIVHCEVWLERQLRKGVLWSEMFWKTHVVIKLILRIVTYNSHKDKVHVEITSKSTTNCQRVYHLWLVISSGRSLENEGREFYGGISSKTQRLSIFQLLNNLEGCGKTVYIRDTG